MRNSTTLVHVSTHTKTFNPSNAPSTIARLAYCEGAISHKEEDRLNKTLTAYIKRIDAKAESLGEAITVLVSTKKNLPYEESKELGVKVANTIYRNWFDRPTTKRALLDLVGTI